MFYSFDQPQTRRPIRSYVRREGRITNAQQKALKTLWPKYGLSHESIIGTNHFFKNGRALDLEIGFGDGKNLIYLAENNPQNMYVGIDVYRPGVGGLLIQLDRLAIENVKIILGDAIDALPTFFEENSISKVMIYFPDPWPKKRHQKRRLIRREFLGQIASYLAKGGELCVSTDCENYADDILNSIEQERLLENVVGSNCYAIQPFRSLLTKYETRGLSSGKLIRDIHARRL